MKDDVTIAKCPNPECKGGCAVQYTDRYDSGDKREHWEVYCQGSNTPSNYGCGYSGPYCLSEAEAIRLHNLLCRPAEDGIAREPVAITKALDMATDRIGVYLHDATGWAGTPEREHTLAILMDELGPFLSFRSPPLEPFERLVSELEKLVEEMRREASVDRDPPLPTDRQIGWGDAADRLAELLKSARGTKT